MKPANLRRVDQEDNRLRTSKKLAIIHGHNDEVIEYMFEASGSLEQLLELWTNSKDGQLAILTLIVNGICICVLANFQDTGFAEKVKWVNRLELKKLMDYLSDKCLEHWGYPRREALAEHDKRLLMYQKYDKALAAMLDEVLPHLEEWRLIDRNKDFIGLNAYTDLIFKWTPRQIEEASCRQLIASSHRCVPQ